MIRTILLQLGVPGACIRHDNANLNSSYGGEIGNLIVDLKGHGRGPRRLLSTHMDTIPSAVGSDPCVEGNRLINRSKAHSLGADARAGCAVLIYAIRELVKKKGDHPPRTFVFFVQEELGLVGSKALEASLLGEPPPELAFNFDGGDVAEIVNQSIGVERLYITVHGIAAHGSRPQNGISAAEIEARAVARLVETGWHGMISQAQGNGTANLGVLHGGTMSNQLMPELNALVEARSFDKRFRDRIIDEWKRGFQETVEHCNQTKGLDKQASVSFSPGPVYDPFFLDEQEPVVVIAKRAVSACGLDPLLIADPGGMDANTLVEAGIPCVGLGMGLYNAHQEDEWLDLEQFNTSCRLAAFLSTDSGK